MTSAVFILVILAAFLHAIWNAMVKKGKDKYVTLTAIVLGHVPVAIIFIFFTPIISLQSLPFIIISATALRLSSHERPRNTLSIWLTYDMPNRLARSWIGREVIFVPSTYIFP